jgi:phosphoribosyl-ATP pyrophosphohydrolase/phosphoribosyl-AMP cyclohydrolase/histidinol dehydrogenase
MSCLLRRLAPGEIIARRDGGIDAATLREASAIVEDVRARGEAAVREHAERFGDVQPSEGLYVDRRELESSLDAIGRDARDVLERTASRIRAFAQAQRAMLHDLEFRVPGGVASHRLQPVDRAGCYAPGGRFPLPSSALMTAITARVAGVREVWIASPRPAPVTLAAAAVAGADGVLCAGGAQAIAALAYGCGPIPPTDVIAGPGNRWVTAAKHVVSADVGIDMLAGPSELLIIADGSADPGLVAADLLAQAEHDVDAIPMLVALEERLIDSVEKELHVQLATLATRQIAQRSLTNGFAVLARDIEQAVEIADRIAPEHLELLVVDAESVAPRICHYGALFVGSRSAEVFGDYGAGPNHVLPTGGTARYRAGLSVFTFLRLQTQLRIDDAVSARQIIDESIALARMEGLEAHARSAERRLR